MVIGIVTSVFLVALLYVCLHQLYLASKDK